MEEKDKSRRYWDSILHELVLESKRLAESSPCPYGLETTDKGFEEYLFRLFFEEKKHRGDAAIATRHFMQKWKWPKQDPWCRYFNFLRIQCAAEFVCQLTARDHSGLVLSFPEEPQRERLLEWILIDHWERCFDVYLKLTAVSIFFSLPFYGLTPAED